MSSSQRNVLVGVVVLVGLGMLAWMILQFANRAANFFLTSGMKITLTAARAEGVADGSPVTYKGVNVGRVTGVRRVLNNQTGEDIVIDALILADPPLPANLHGRIKQTSLLGSSATIALEPIPLPNGSATQPARNPAPRLLLTESANLPAEYVPDLTSLGDNIRDMAGSLQETIRAVNQVIGDPKVQDDIKVSLTNARATLESANRTSARLEKLGERLDQVAADAQGTMGDVRKTVKDGGVEMQKLSTNLNQRIQQIAETLQHVQSVAEKIDQGKGTAGQLVNNPKLYESLTDTASELNLMVKDMRRLIQQWEEEGIIKL